MNNNFIKNFSGIVNSFFSKKKLASSYAQDFIKFFEQENYEGANEVLNSARHMGLNIPELLNVSGRSHVSHNGFAENVFMRVKNINMLKYLLDNGADPTFRDRQKNNGIFFHLLRQPDCIAYLIEKDIDTLIEKKYTHSERDVLSLLIGSAPLIDTNAHFHNIKAILDKSPEKIERVYPNEGHTPLIQACEQGHPEIVRLLLERGANPHFGVWVEGFEERDKKITFRETPITVAAFKKNYDAVDLLLNFNATLTDMALFKEEIEKSEFSQQEETIAKINRMIEKLEFRESLLASVPQKAVEIVDSIMTTAKPRKQHKI